MPSVNVHRAAADPLTTTSTCCVPHGGIYGDTLNSSESGAGDRPFRCSKTVALLPALQEPPTSGSGACQPVIFIAAIEVSLPKSIIVPSAGGRQYRARRCIE